MSTELSPGSRPSAPLALIAGPTASGKSELALRLALALRDKGRESVIINADSAQVYRDLMVLSARPSPDEMKGVPHRLFGTWDGSDTCSAADWAEQARIQITAAHDAGLLPILVGGTGLYMRTLLEGIAPVPAIPPEIRQEVRAMPIEAAFGALQREDPGRADHLNPADTARIARALEVIRATGRSLDHWQKHKVGGIGNQISLHAAVLLPDRAWLYQRCDNRFATMLERGAIEEVRALLARGLAPSQPVMRAIGVPELRDFLEGRCTLEEASLRGAQATRNYAKRQYTWFRRQPPAEWKRIESQDYEFDGIFASLLRELGLT